MDSWPAWVRWLVVLPIAFAIASVFWILANLFRNAAFFELAVLPVSFLFVWCGVATAPRFKLTVGFILALVSLRLASHVFFDFTESHWFFPFGRGVLLFTFWIMPESWPYLIGLAIASDQPRGVVFDVGGTRLNGPTGSGPPRSYWSLGYGCPRRLQNFLSTTDT